LDEECQISFEDKKKGDYNTMINRNTRKKWQEQKGKTKAAHKIFKQKRQYCLNQSWSKWKLLINTMKQRHFIKKWIL